MSLKKRASKSIALVLVGITITTPILNHVNDMENNKDIFISEISENENLDMREVYSDESIKLMKKEFNDKFGTDNNFKLISNKDGIKLEINGATGDIKTTIEGEEPLIVNYFEGIDYMKNMLDNSVNEVSPRYALSKHYRSSGPDQSYLKVYTQSGKSNMLVARNTKGETKTYYKSASTWDSGNTKLLRQEIESAKNNWDKASSSLNKAGTKVLWNLLASYISAGAFTTPSSVILAALNSYSLGVNVATAASRGASYLMDLNDINKIHKKL